MKRWILLCLLLVPSVVMAQDAAETDEPEAVEYALEFPLDLPNDFQVEEAYNCVLDTSTEPVNDDIGSCEMALEALKLAEARGEDSEVSDEEIELVNSIVLANPSLLLRLDVIATYFNLLPLVAPPEFASQPITDMHLTYTFAGLGPANDYDITITNADTTPEVSGTVEISGGEDDAEQPALPETIDSEVVQAFAPALSDLLPIAEQFSSAPCWDYYPDWTVELTFADGTTITMVTNSSNVVGIGGPWQVEIDDQNYMQYSSSFSSAVIGLFEALEIPLGETAAMGCGGVDEPLHDAFPRADADSEAKSE